MAGPDVPTDFHRRLNGELDYLRAFARVRRAESPEDLVHDTICRALANAHRFDGRDMHAWLGTILARTHLNQLRAQARLSHDPSDPVRDTLAAPQERYVEAREVAHRIARLPPVHRDVVLLVCLQGLSYAEAAERLDVRIGTVMSRLARAREALRD